MNDAKEASAALATGWFRRMAGWFVEGIGHALSRFPVAAAAIAILSGLANAEVAGVDVIDADHVLRLILAFAAASAGSVIAELLLEAKKASDPARLAGSLAVGLGAGLLVWFGGGVFLFVPPLIAAMILAIPLAPYLRRSTSLRFWTFTTGTVLGVSLGFVSVLLFVLGVSAILEMVRYLFEVGLGPASYRYIYTTALTLIGPLFALGRIPRDFDEEPATGRSDRLAGGIGVLQDWVATPLVLAAALVLHLYAAKILLTADVPKNQIGWIVGAYALFVLSQRIAAEPFLRTGGIAMRLFGRIWAPILVVPLLLLGYAVVVRVGAEGFTAERYYLVIATLAAALVVLAQVPPASRSDTRVMAAIPLILLAASSLGPWGVLSTVGRSQTALIVRDFAGSDGELQTAGMTPERRGDLRSRIEALADADALDRLLPLLPPPDREIVAAAGAGNRKDAFLTRLGLDYGAPTQNAVLRRFVASKSAPLDVEGFDRVFTLLDAEAGTQAATGKTSAERPTVRLDGPHLAIAIGMRTDRLDLASIVAAIPDMQLGDDPDETEPYVADAVTEGGRRVRLRVRSLTVDPGGVFATSLSFDLIVRRADWTS